MKKTLIIISLLITPVYACNQKEGKKHQTLLTTSQLASEIFNITIDRDTTLLTKKGALIHIPGGAISSNGKTNVKLEVKEAYSMQDILLAGLTTQSNGQPLSSGGMIYINTVEENFAKLNKPISVGLPADHLQKDMQLFKGDSNKDGTINWQDTTPLPPNKQLTAIEQGEQLFKQNCASCHAIDKDLTGPALAHTWGEGTIWFIQNSAAVIATGDRYYNCLFEHWNRAVMPSFPLLTNQDVMSIYQYVENESARLQLPRSYSWYEKCHDSCFVYQAALRGITIKRQEFIDENGPLLIRDLSGMIRGDLDSCINCIPNKVIRNDFPSVYYQFDITVLGWYNIDMLLRDMPEAKESTLTVKVPGRGDTAFNVFLVIPSVKLYQEGGLLQGESDKYGFFTLDGKVPLPQGATARVFAFGEGKDEILFADTTFTTQLQQELQLNLKKVTKQQFYEAVRSMGLNNIDINVKDSKNAADIRKIDTALTAAEKLKPKNCDCNCGVRMDEK
jgi:mono/diheme cytochrome c family protein